MNPNRLRTHLAVPLVALGPRVCRHCHEPIHSGAAYYRWNRHKVDVRPQRYVAAEGVCQACYERWQGELR